jgi:hypothetical protein
MATNRKQPDRPKDWEDEYHRLKDDYEALKVLYNEKEGHNKL